MDAGPVSPVRWRDGRPRPCNVPATRALLPPLTRLTETRYSALPPLALGLCVPESGRRANNGKL